MKRLHQLITATLVLTLTTVSVYGQDVYQEDAYNSDSSAYIESSNTAHWSIYIPIAVLVGAAIWFGVADQHDPKHYLSDSQDALGSIANSKRISKHHASSRSNKSQASNHSKSRSSSCNCSRSSQGSYSH
jgi:hypothetical protein